ncbi:MAG: RnfH family protein [Aquabacterium sp.]
MSKHPVAHEDLIAIEVAHDAGPHAVQVQALQLPLGATLEAAVLASGTLSALDDAVRALWVPAIWGRAQPWDRLLRDGDRVELTRPLQVDPKEARRQRYRRDGLPRQARKPAPPAG